MRYTGLGSSYELEQPVEIHLDHDNVLASGDGCVYTHEPFAGLRKGLYLFNWQAFTPGVSALEGFVRFDSFDRPQFVPKDEATHVYWGVPTSDAGMFHEYEQSQKAVKMGNYLPVERRNSQLTTADPGTKNWVRDFDCNSKEWSEADIAKFTREHKADLDKMAEKRQRVNWYVHGDT